MTNEDKCTGKGCPLSAKCARMDPVVSRHHYLTPPYDKRSKMCVGYISRRLKSAPHVGIDTKYP
jgi:hypothetical protein